MLKDINYFGKVHIFACDGKCSKAWGINSRPKNMLSEDDDDYEYLSDKELEEAPVDPGTYEGCHGKPTMSEHPAPNKWCVRECERSVIVLPGEILTLRDFDKRLSNMGED